MATLAALLSSLLWGGGDFLGGRSSRRFGVLRVLFWSQLAMLALLWSAVAMLLVAGLVELDPRRVIVASAGGIAGVIALGAFYRALAIGPMSVVPPIAAAGVALPVAVGLVTGAAPSATVLAGIALAVVGAILASVGEGTSDDARIPTRIAPRTLLLCLVAAVGFGLIFVAMDAAAGDGIATALVATAGVRLGSAGVIVLASLVMRMRPADGMQRRDLVTLVSIGLLDTGANFAFVVAAAWGELEVVAVLGSLYPAVTSALAHVVLGERLGRVQLVGVGFAMAGVALLATR